MYDLNLMPIHTQEGQRLSQPSGFQAVSPPRRAAHSRAEDLLILSLILNENKSISAEQEAAWLARLATIFYKTSGSVTAALRSLIETLNLTMMEKNLKLAANGSASTGAINLAAIHRRRLFIAQSGLTHAYVLNHQGLQHFYDSSQSDRGLGLSRSANIRYYQADLGTGAYLFMTDRPQETWRDDLLFLDGFPSFDQLQRRLLNQAPSNFRLDLVKIKPGEGQINTIQGQIKSSRPNEMEETSTRSPEPPQDSSEVDESLGVAADDTREIKTKHNQDTFEKDQDLNQEEAKPDQQQIDEDLAAEELEIETASEEELPKSTDERETPLPSRVRAAAPSVSMGTQAKQASAQRRPQQEKAVEKSSREAVRRQREQIRKRGLKAIGGFLKKWRNVREGIETFFKDILARWSPSSEGKAPTLSRGMMLFIAVAVPLAVVAVAVGVYFARGRTLQYRYYYEMAEAASVSASSAEDPSIARQEWSQTLGYLDQAEAFRDTEEIQSLRSEARDALDRLDGVVRLTYRPAIIGSLYSDSNITRIISYGPDLYLLDEINGRVIHAIRTNQGYEIDIDFICGAGNFSGGGVDNLVDMASLPINNPYQAHLIAVDVTGNVIYCAPGQDPVVQSLPSPDTANNDIDRIAYANNFLYVLNRGVNTIHVYRATNGQFLDAPSDYFADAGEGEKPDLSRIIDLAVNGPELYLLRSDGLLDDCIASGLPGDPVNCENPVEYVDGRPGKEEQSLTMPDSNYEGLLYTSPPDPSVSILDGSTGDIYRFSLRFRLYDRIRPNLGNYEINTPEATAFTIGIDRFAFLAFGNQIFYAYIE